MEVLTFAPLKRGRYRCNQTGQITKNPKGMRFSHARNTSAFMMNLKQEKEEERQRVEFRRIKEEKARQQRANSSFWGYPSFY